MRVNWPGIRWGRGVLVGVLAPLVSFLAVTVVIFVYGFVLGFRARGMPDIGRIGSFASHFAPWAAPVLSLLLTLGGATWVARKAHAAVCENGVFTGLAAAVVGLLVSLLPRGAFRWDHVMWFVLTVGAGVLGGFLATLGHPASSGQANPG